MGNNASKISSMASKSNNEIRRLWGDIEVVDAKKDLRVFISPEDVRSATAKDPGCCVFAQACKRQFSATKVLFWRSVAYVELPGQNGKRRVERFALSPQMRSLIEDFDRGRPVAMDAGFELQAVKPSMQFERKRLVCTKWRERRKKALLNGTRLNASSGNQGKGKYSKPAIVVDLEVRSGRGRVQFKRREELKNGR
jgi:hypothetical protein